MLANPPVDVDSKRAFGHVRADPDDQLAWVGVATAHAEKDLGVSRAALRFGDAQQFERGMLPVEDVCSDTSDLREGERHRIPIRS